MDSFRGMTADSQPKKNHISEAKMSGDKKKNKRTSADKISINLLAVGVGS